jgi:hypothetical protein
MHILVGTRKGLFVYRRESGRWRLVRQEFLGAPVKMVMHDPRTGAVHAVLDHGHFGVKFHRAAEVGAAFLERPVPAYPPKPDDVEDLEPFRRVPIPWKLLGVWSLVPATAAEPGVLWCGTLPGGLFRSGDDGESWELVRSLWDDPARKSWVGGGADWPGIHSICVHPTRKGHVTIAISCGGVRVTEDGGRTWHSRAKGIRAAYVPPERAYDEDVQDPHCVVQCRAAPEVLWCQHHNGIFRSVDGGRNWTEIPEAGPSTFGFAVAVHPDDPETAWFLPAQKDEVRIPVDGRVVMTRTRDGGRSFQVLDRGLPPPPAFDLCLRHALDVDPSGRTLAFGSTTGGLFITEDQGESFQILSAHLPPVYAVRILD